MAVQATEGKMEATQQIVVMLDEGVGAPAVLAQYPVGSWGFETAMFFVLNRSGQLRNTHPNLSDQLWIEISGQRWDYDDIIGTAIIFDASHYPDQLDTLEDLFDRFAPDFVETPESRIAHLDEAQREMFSQISIGTDRQVKYAQDLFLNDKHREQRLSVLDICASDIEQPDTSPEMKEVASFMLSHVAMCSVFWIEQASSMEVNMAILEQITGTPGTYRTDKVIKLSAQIDKATGP